MIEIAIEARNSARLEQLIARITAKIKKSDAASVGASSASLGSAAIEPYTSSVAAESPNSIPTYNAGLPSLATLPAIPCNSGIPTLPAIPEFPRRRRGPKPRGPRIHLVTGGPSSPDCGHEPSSSHSCKHEAFRLYAYTTGKRHQEEGRLGEITFKQIIDDYVAANPGNVLPKSIAQSLQWDTLKAALSQDNYNMFVLKRAREPVRDTPSMQDKLLLRPDLGPVVKWCMAWIQATRRQGVLPTFENMKNAWTSEQARNPTNAFFNGLITPKHASQQCGVNWTCYMQYEKTLIAAQDGPGAAAAAAADPSARLTPLQADKIFPKKEVA